MEGALQWSDLLATGLITYWWKNIDKSIWHLWNNSWKDCISQISKKCLWMQSLRMQNTFISEWAHDSNINHFLVTFSYWKWVVPWKTTVVLKWFETAGLIEFVLSLYHYIHPFVVFFLQGICVCLYWWMCACQTRMSSEQWRQITSSMSYVLHVEFSLHRKVK